MTYAEVLAFINLWIATNHNNEITADVLRPVLVAILDRQNAVTGNPDDLATTDQSNLVAAINEVLALVNGGSSGGIKLYSGTDDPNTTPPLTYGYADFYMMVTGLNEPVQLYQYDGFSWVTTGKIALADGTGTTISGTGTTFDPYMVNVSSSGSSWNDTPQEDTATETTANVITLPASKTAVQVFIGGLKILASLVTQVGTSVTINYETFGGEIIETYYKD